MPVLLKTALLLTASNVFMTFAWYAHLKDLNHRPWFVAALVSWGIAFFEYLLQVPANRLGHTQYDLGQLKILQEVITLAVFVPFAVFYMREPVKLDYLWAALACVGRYTSFFARRTRPPDAPPAIAREPGHAAADAHPGFPTAMPRRRGVPASAPLASPHTRAVSRPRTARR